MERQGEIGRTSTSRGIQDVINYNVVTEAYIPGPHPFQSGSFDRPAVPHPQQSNLRLCDSHTISMALS